MCTVLTTSASETVLFYCGHSHHHTVMLPGPFIFSDFLDLDSNWTLCVENVSSAKITTTKKSHFTTNRVFLHNIVHHIKNWRITITEQLQSNSNYTSFTNAATLLHFIQVQIIYSRLDNRYSLNTHIFPSC